jgi:hypothetical protein
MEIIAFRLGRCLNESCVPASGKTRAARGAEAISFMAASKISHFVVVRQTPLTTQRRLRVSTGRMAMTMGRWSLASSQSLCETMDERSRRTSGKSPELTKAKSMRS